MRWLLPLACACSPTIPEPLDSGDSGLSGPFELVVDGVGSGVYEAGATVDVFALHDPYGEAFLGWEGDVEGLESTAEWHTRLTMPAHDAVLTPRVATRDRVLEQGTWTGSTGVPKSWHMLRPEGEAQGLMLMLHGTMGNSAILTKPEGHAVAMAATERGWVALAPTSEETATGTDANGDGKLRWDVLPGLDNADLHNLERLLDEMVGDVVPADAPLVVMGMSNGGGMTVSLNVVASASTGAVWPHLSQAEAFASYCAGARVETMAAVERPLAWFMCAQDTNENVGPGAVDDVRVASAALAERGVRTEVVVQEPSPLYPLRFARVDGIDGERSAALYDELVAGGHVDEAGTVVSVPGDVRAAFAADPETLPSLQGLDVWTVLDAFGQLEAAYADHQMFSDHAERMLDFLVAE